MNPRGDFPSFLAESLALLYLPGFSRPADPPRRRWRAVEAVLRRQGPKLDLLRGQGLTLEALLLAEASLLASARSLVREGRVLTSACEGYPRRWLERRDLTPPPAFWRRGPVPSSAFVSVVGSRHIGPEIKRMAAASAGAVAAAGYSVVSGGAAGCDSAAARGAFQAGGHLLQILPCGLAHRPSGNGCFLSAVALRQEFSAAAAMERNTLVYASAEAAIVVHARAREGGTWAGAAEALRRRLCPVYVWDSPLNPAAPLLRALGARPFTDLSQLPAMLAVGTSEYSLFRDIGQSPLPVHSFSE